MSPAGSTAETAARAPRKDVVRNRARLLEAANELIAQYGSSVSLDAVAKHAGVGVGTVYRHFPDKADLLSALFERRLDTLQRLLEEAAEAEDAYAALRQCIVTAVELEASDVGFWHVIAAGDPVQHDLRARERLQPGARRLVGRAKATGKLRPEFSETDLPMIIWTMGAITQHTGGAGPEIWRRYLQAMLDGFAAVDQPREPLAVAALTTDQMDAAKRSWRGSAR